MRHALPLLALVAVVLGGAPRPALAENATEAERALRAELAASYAELGAWCVKKQLFLARDELAAVILSIEPEHAKARGWLKYRKGKDGTWARRTPYKAPKNRKPRHLPEYEQRKQAIADALRPRVIATIRDAQPAFSHARRSDFVGFWRPILGESEELMALAGRTQHEGRWRSTDTVRSLKRRAAMRTAATNARANQPVIAKRALPEAARAIDLPWKPGRGSKRVAAYGTVSGSMLDACVRMVHATEHMLAVQFGGTFETRDYFALYVMKGREHFRTVIDRHPDIRGDRKVLRDLSGAYIGHGQFVDLMETQAGTLDSCISVATQHLLSLRFAEGRSEWMPGWVADGFALYNMTWLTGTHLSFTVDLGRYGQDPLFKSLFSSATDWFAEASKLMLSAEPATLRLALGLKVGRMGPRDFLASYAFVAWLQEARTEQERGALLAALAAGHDMDKAFATALGMTIEDAESRLKVWLREVGGD